MNCCYLWIIVALHRKYETVAVGLISTWLLQELPQGIPLPGVRRVQKSLQLVYVPGRRGYGYGRHGCGCDLPPLL